MELSLVRTLANKYKTTGQKVYARHATTIETQAGRDKVFLEDLQAIRGGKRFSRPRP